MRKFLITLCIIACLALLGSAALAERIGDYDVECTEGDTIYICKYYGSEADVVIPGTFTMYNRDMPVYDISYECFAYNDDITSVTIPKDVFSISYRAFYGCENLQKINILSDRISINDEAFAYCTALTEISIPATIDYAGTDVFKGCPNLVLTGDQQSAFANNSYAVEQARIAAFEPDFSKMVDLCAFMRKDINWLAQSIGGMSKDYTEDGCCNYYHNDFSMSSYTEEELVDYISFYNPCNYSAAGVYMGMYADDAIEMLLSAGWRLTGMEPDYWTFANSAKTEITFGEDENRNVSYLTVSVPYDLYAYDYEDYSVQYINGDEDWADDSGDDQPIYYD